MLTRAGVIVLIGSLLLAGLGRVLGILELFVLAAAGVGLVLIALVNVRWRPPRMEIQRVVRPSRVHAGTASRVELTVTNVGPSRSPVLAVDDAVSGTAGAHLLISPIASRASVSATYRLPTDQRGVVQVGPLVLQQPDPFGLARRVQRVGLDAELTVLPRVVDLLPLPHSRGHDPVPGGDHPDHLGRGGDDFYGLRPYVVGDDLRRVHWLSTARSGDLLVRQDEQPRQGRVTVILDNRRGTADATSFETMVVATASIVAAARRRGDVVRLRTTSSADPGAGHTTGFDTGFITGHGQADALMEHLAVVGLEAGIAWPSSLARDTGPNAGSVIMVVGDVSQADFDAMLANRAHGSDLTVARIGPRTRPSSPAGSERTRGRVRVVDVPDEAALAPVWNQAMAQPGRRARARAQARPR